MLTIKAPIEIAAKTGYIGNNKGFNERIRGNYALMGMEVSGQDLLHLVMTPPEIFFAEGSEANVFNSRSNININEEKTEIINNVLNRITVNAVENLTYQDRAYITDVLYKLGIRDDKTFMEEVRKIINETDTTNSRIDMFFSNIDRFTDLADEITNYQREEKNEENITVSEENEQRLYESILNRLNTGAIYQILSNFYSQTGASAVSNMQMMISEQSYTAKQIMLNRMRSAARSESVPLIYKSENIYENPEQESEGGISEVNNELSSAVFLDMIRNLYHTETENENIRREWVDVRNAFYRAGDNTLIRMKSSYELPAVVIPKEEGSGRSQDEIPAEKESSEEEETRISFPEEAGDEEAIAAGLRLINEQNIENYARYREFIEVLQKARVRRAPGKSAEDRRKDIVAAIENPEEFIRNVRNEETKQEIINKEYLREEVKRIFPNETDRVFAIIESYLTGENIENINEFVRKGDISNLMADIAMTERERVLTESRSEKRERIDTILRRDGRLSQGDTIYPENINNAEYSNIEFKTDRNTNEIRQIINENTDNETQTVINNEIKEETGDVRRQIEALERLSSALSPNAREGTEGENIALIHKKNEELPTEEIMETIEEYRRNTERRLQDISEEAVTERNITRNVTVNNVSETTDRVSSNRAEIEEMISNGVRKQMGVISEEVIGRIEKRLKNEKSRRGF